MDALKVGVVCSGGFFSLPPPVRFPNGILSHSSSKAKCTVWPLSMAVILHHLTCLALLLTQASSALPTGFAVLVFLLE